MLQGLSKLLADHASGCCREQKYDNYFGRKIAIDASMHIYQALVRCHPNNQHCTTVCTVMKQTLSDSTAGCSRPNRRSNVDK